jgi:hypothetical protein
VKAERFLAISRDTSCLVIGAYGIVHMEYTGKVNEALLVVFTAMLGVPGIAGLLSLRKQIGGAGGTTVPPLPSPPPLPQPESSQSSSST